MSLFICWRYKIDIRFAKSAKNKNSSFKYLYSLYVERIMCCLYYIQWYILDEFIWFSSYSVTTKTNLQLQLELLVHWAALTGFSILGKKAAQSIIPGRNLARKAGRLHIVPLHQFFSMPRADLNGPASQGWCQQLKYSLCLRPLHEFGLEAGAFLLGPPDPCRAPHVFGSPSVMWVLYYLLVRVLPICDFGPGSLDWTWQKSQMLRFAESLLSYHGGCDFCRVPQSCMTQSCLDWFFKYCISRSFVSRTRKGEGMVSGLFINIREQDSPLSIE